MHQGNRIWVYPPLQIFDLRGRWQHEVLTEGALGHEFAQQKQ